MKGENNWEVTNLGPSALLDEQLKSFHYITDSIKKVSRLDAVELQQKINDKKAHLPFEKKEQLAQKMGEGKFSLFGRGARRCPAATDVSVLCKFLIASVLKNYELSNREVVKRVSVLPPEGSSALKP